MQPLREHRWVDADSETLVQRLTPGVLLTKHVGRLTTDAVPFVRQVMGQELGTPPGIQAFWDLEELEYYHPQIRSSYTDLLKKHRSQFRSIHAFTRSKLVAMGAAVVNLAIGGGIEVYARREMFERALHRAVAEGR